MKAYWASDRMGSMVWEMHGDEDMKTGGLEERRSRGEKDRVFQHSTAQHTQPFQSCPAQWEQEFPVLRIPSAAAGVAGLVFLAVRGQVFWLTVPGSAMGMSVSSTTTYAGQVLQSAVGMGSSGGAQEQDWCSESCVVCGDGAVPDGHGPSAQVGCCLVGMGWR